MTEMCVLRFSNDSISKYFEFLKHLDNKSKKKLITELSNSIKSSKIKTNSANVLKMLYGSWDDERSTEEIIEDVQGSRTENRNIEDL